MEKDGTQMEGCHSVRFGEVRGANDRFICMHQQQEQRRNACCFFLIKVKRFLNLRQ